MTFDPHHIAPGPSPSTLAAPVDYERVELEDQGIEILVPASYVRFLRRQGKALEVKVQFEPEPSPLPPLTAEQQAVLTYLREHGVTPAEELAHHTGYSVRTIKTWCGPNGNLRRYGIVPSEKGYGIV